MATLTRTVNIIPAPTVSFSTEGTTGEENITPVDLIINLSRSDINNSTVDDTLSGTAINNLDYVLANGTASFVAGETSTTISIPITQDTLKEID